MSSRVNPIPSVTRLDKSPILYPRDCFGCCDLQTAEFR